MGAESCKSCDKSQNREDQINDGKTPTAYGTAGGEERGSRTNMPAAAAQRAAPIDNIVDKGTDILSPGVSIDVRSDFNNTASTIGSGDAAGGADAKPQGQDIKAGNAGPPATGSYSSTYFGREAAELQALEMPPAGSPSTYRKTHIFKTGATYDGQWRGNERDGFGRQRWPDGAEYQGQWGSNAANGKGKFKHSDDSVYIGEWKDNIAHGYGIYRHKDGTTYEGSFAEDLQDGEGVESWADKSTFVGQFLRGKKNGYGEYTWPDSSKYSGQWKMNQIDGIGAYVGADKRKFNGCWKVSMMHGVGKYQWPDGRAYEGQYVEDQKDGFGIFTWADGRYYEGFWKEGRQDGFGRLYQDGGCSRLAKWVGGERVEWCEEGDQ